MLQFVLPVLIIAAVLVWAYRKVSKTTPDYRLSKSEKKDNNAYTLDDKFNQNKKAKQEELDALLDKISKKGIDHLSQEERKRLEELSQP